MLRTNLSTRPFYNERAVHLLLAAAGLLVIVLAAFNALRIVTLSRQNTELSAVVNTDRNEAQRLTQEAQKIRAGINQEELRATAEAALSANTLIDQRTFSWTVFFNHIEATLPPDVMLTSVQPIVKENVTMVQMTVLGRQTEDVDEFMEKLEATGAFEDVLPSQEDPTDEGLHRVVLSSVYTGAAPAETPAAPDATKPSTEAEKPGAPAASPDAAQPEVKPAPPADPGRRGQPPAPNTGRGGRGR